MITRIFHISFYFLFYPCVLGAQSSILSENQKLYIGEISGVSSKQFNKQIRLGESFDLTDLTQSKNLIEIRCYESNVFLVNHCTVLTYDTSFSLIRKVIQYRPYDTSKYLLVERNGISTMNVDSVFRQLIATGIFSCKPLKGQEKKRMILNRANQLEVYKGLLGVTDGTTYRIDVKIGEVYKTIFTSSQRIVSANYFLDDIDLKREKAIVNLLEAKPALIPK
jgi:hypothetical protein